MKTNSPKEDKANAGSYSILVPYGRKQMPDFIKQQLSSGRNRLSDRVRREVTPGLRNMIKKIDLKPYYKEHYDRSGRNVATRYAAQIECTL